MRPRALIDADFLVNDLKAQRIVVVLCGERLWPGIAARKWSKRCEDLGRPPVEVIGIQEAADTYAAVLPRIKAANPDAVFLAGYETEGYVLLPELREAGIQATFVASDGCFLYDFIDGSGRRRGRLCQRHYPRPQGRGQHEPGGSLPARSRRAIPGTYSIAGYSAMTVLAEGVKQGQ